MKKALSVVSLLLAVVMIALCCAACGDDDKGADTSKYKEYIVGKWNTEFEIGKIATAMADQGTDTMAQLYTAAGEALADVKVKVSMSFNEDGTCSLIADKDSVEAANTEIKTKLTDTLTPLLTAMGVSAEQIETIMSRALSLCDLSYLTVKRMLQYELDGEKLYLYTQNDGKDSSSYYKIELTSSEMKVTDVEGSSQYLTDSMLPLTFTKAN